MEARSEVAGGTGEVQREKEWKKKKGKTERIRTEKKSGSKNGYVST